MKNLFYAITALVICSPAIHAQQIHGDSVKVYYGSPVVVTGTREGMTSNLVPASISVVTSKELKSTGQVSLLDALSERVPDLFVAQRGVIGYGINTQAGTISIRGLGGSPNTQVLVLIDGVPQFMGLFGHPLPDSYMSEYAERVEVIRGPASVLYGTNAMGGIINIVTKKNMDAGPLVRAGATYGSFNTQEYHGSAGFGTDKLDVLLSGGHSHTDGHRPNSAFDGNDAYMNAGYKASDNFMVRMNGSVYKFKTYNPGTIYSPLTDNWSDVLRSNENISINNDFPQFDGSLKLFYSFGDHDVFDGFHSLDRNAGAMFYQNYRPYVGSIFTFGADYEHYGGTAVNNITGQNFGKYYIDECGMYVLVEQLLFERVMLNAGARIEHNSVYRREFVPQAGVAWMATGSSTLKASVSKGFRSPTIRELYLFPAPNPDLQPERMWNYEVGLLQSFTDRAHLELTGFVAVGSNLILAEGIYPNIRLLNSGSFMHRGIEFAGHSEPIDRLIVDASYSYVDPGNQTYSTPKQKLFIGLGYSYNAAGVNITLRRIMDLYGADNSQKKLPDYTLVGAHLNYKASKFADATLSCENLLNISYQTIYGYPMPGRTLLAGVNIHTAEVTK